MGGCYLTYNEMWFLGLILSLLVRVMNSVNILRIKL